MDVKARGQGTVDEQRRRARSTCRHRIHANPELCFEEEQASAWAAEALADGGFAVEAGVCDLPTAFVATAGSGPLTIAICAEYDALPGIGHACGHNVIAAAAVGAGLALAPLADDLGITVKVMGTPAEEGGGGKILMLERGAFDGVHAAMMVHPAPIEMDHMPCLAVSHVEVHYTGKEAHASAFPELGINAADALTVAQIGDRPAAPAHPATRPHPRHRDPRRRRAQHRARPHHRQVVHPQPHAGRAGRARAHASTGASRPAPWPPAARSRSSRRARRYSEISRRPRHARRSTGANAEALGRAFPDLRGRRRSASPARPTWPTSPSPSRRSTPCSASTRFRRSTTSPSSPPSASPRRPTRPSSTAPRPWPGPCIDLADRRSAAQR